MQMISKRPADLLPFVRHRHQVALVRLTSRSVNRFSKKREKDPKDSSDPELIREAVLVRRRGGYAAAEARLHRRRVQLCCVEAGEIVGDVETVFGLATHLQTVTATEPVEAYLLTAKNMERLLSKRTSSTTDALAMSVETKMKNRLDRFHGGDASGGDRGGENDGIPLFRRLLYRMHRPLEPAPVKIPPLRQSKALPDRDVLFQHLLRTFVDDRAALVEPRVPGGVYYREMMCERARLRRTVDRLNPKAASKRRNVAGRKKVFKVTVRKPMTEEALNRIQKRADAERRARERVEMRWRARCREERQIDEEFDRVKNSFRMDESLLNGGKSLLRVC